MATQVLLTMASERDVLSTMQTSWHRQTFMIRQQRMET